ncbi:MAG: hypothetical protein GF308_06740 [Candidatus Heimdallarchaeota archaeon]|nr:hypothetical protein [Candidatus Heimdallarchaeota archaeon]
MQNFNQQILDFLLQKEQVSSQVSDDQIYTLLKEVMKELVFGNPVTDEEELTEVINLCFFYYKLTHQSIDSFLEKYTQKRSPVFEVGLSLTERCGYGCHHCSTNASLAADKVSVPFSQLQLALSEMAPRTKVLYISCEGDPFYYESLDPNQHEATRKRTIVDVTQTLMELGYPAFSLQSLAPNDRLFTLLEGLFNIIDQNKQKDFIFYPQISFNLYPARAGLKIKKHANDSQHPQKELIIPSLDNQQVETWVTRLISSLKKTNVKQHEDRDDSSNPKFDSITRKLRIYLSDVKKTILTYASRGYEIHFELRGDNYSKYTNLQTVNLLLDQLLEQLAREHPEIPFPKCPTCSKVHYSKKQVQIVPLGRAVQLFPNGEKASKKFFDGHIINPKKYLCPNWFAFGNMTIDTRGFPQLCYSNLALTSQARTSAGPNLYDDGFDTIISFYLQVWQDRLTFLKKKLTEIVRQRPNEYYCPLFLFKKTLQKFSENS